MGRKQLVSGILGIVIGFILGFFVSQFIHQGPSKAESPQTETEEKNASQMPERHPPPEVVERLQALQDRARANPNDKEIRIALGNLYYDMGRFDAAVGWYEEALELDPSNVSVRTDLGTAYLYTGDAAKAIALYQKSLKADPHHPQTLQNLGFAYLYRRQFAEALQMWQRLIDAHPEYPHIREIKKQMEDARAQQQKERS